MWIVDENMKRKINPDNVTHVTILSDRKTIRVHLITGKYLGVAFDDAEQAKAAYDSVGTPEPSE